MSAWHLLFVPLALAGWEFVKHWLFSDDGEVG